MHAHVQYVGFDSVLCAHLQFCVGGVLSERAHHGLQLLRRDAAVAVLVEERECFAEIRHLLLCQIFNEFVDVVVEATLHGRGSSKSLTRFLNHSLILTSYILICIFAALTHSLLSVNIVSFLPFVR